jgi:hypothetical protein
MAPPNTQIASRAADDGRFAAATGEDLKMPAPTTMPMHTATACHALSLRNGAVGTPVADVAALTTAS